MAELSLYMKNERVGVELQIHSFLISAPYGSGELHISATSGETAPPSPGD